MWGQTTSLMAGDWRLCLLQRGAVVPHRLINAGRLYMQLMCECFFSNAWTNLPTMNEYQADTAWRSSNTSTYERTVVQQACILRPVPVANCRTYSTYLQHHNKRGPCLPLKMGVWRPRALGNSIARCQTALGSITNQERLGLS